MNNILGSATVAAGFPMVKQGKLQVATVKKVYTWEKCHVEDVP